MDKSEIINKLLNGEIKLYQIEQFTDTIDEFKKSVSTAYGVGYINPKKFPIHALYYNQYMKAIEQAEQYFDYIKELTQ